MSLIKYTYVALMLLLAGPARAQMFTDQGMFSGSGLTIMPTATLAPQMEYRIQYSRLSYFKGSGLGMNIMSMTAGFSTTLETYFRFGSEQSGSFASQIAYGVGGKFKVPLLLPVIRRLALWADLTATEQTIPTAIFPSDAFRSGAVMTLDSNGVHPTILIGINKLGTAANALLGAGVTIAAGNSVQLGFETVYGYLGRNSIQIAPSASLRVIRNIGLQISPSYLSLPSGSLWMMSVGFSLTTTDIDFHPAVVEQASDEFILPSIEDIEQETKGGENVQPSGEGSLLDNSIQQDGGDGTLISKDRPTQKTSVETSSDDRPLPDEQQNEKESYHE